MVKQCCATDGVEPQYIKDEILPDFFSHFWQHRMALDRRNYRQVTHAILYEYDVCFLKIIKIILSTVGTLLGYRNNVDP